MSAEKADIIAALQREILHLEGFRPGSHAAVDLSLGPFQEAFPNGTFPTGAVHEFLTTGMEQGAATSGFMAGLLAPLMGDKGVAMWVSATRRLFPPALQGFGIAPDRFIFLDLKKERDVLWAMEETLKCGALAAVVGEVGDMSFTASRRLQLAVEQSRVTGFVLRHAKPNVGTTACVSRWRITPAASEPEGGLPGLGFPQWKVELLRMRNGKPGVWNIRWEDGRFSTVYTPMRIHEQQQQVG
jgi:protein ImuA